ncbi:hypothetical protein M1D32_00240 [Arthrobacter sp. D3-16]
MYLLPCVPSDELFQWWSDRVGATGLSLYGRKLWETMSSHWPAADQQPGATAAQNRVRPPLAFFAALDNCVNLSLVEVRTFPNGVILTRYETRR